MRKAAAASGCLSAARFRIIPAYGPVDSVKKRFRVPVPAADRTTRRMSLNHSAFHSASGDRPSKSSRLPPAKAHLLPAIPLPAPPLSKKQECRRCSNSRLFRNNSSQYVPFPDVGTVRLPTGGLFSRMQTEQHFFCRVYPLRRR